MQRGWNPTAFFGWDMRWPTLAFCVRAQPKKVSASAACSRSAKNVTSKNVSISLITRLDRHFSACLPQHVYDSTFEKCLSYHNLRASKLDIYDHLAKVVIELA